MQFAPSLYLPKGQWLLATFGVVLLAIEAWIVAEGLRVWPRIEVMLEETLPPFEEASVASKVS